MPISPVKGLSSSKTRKIAQANDRAHTIQSLVARHVLSWCGGGLSVHPAANNGPPWCNNSTTDNRTDDRTSNDHGTAWGDGDAARAIDAARADDGACVHRAQGDEASCQQ
jgi:hypothetical protein